MGEGENHEVALTVEPPRARRFPWRLVAAISLFAALWGVGKLTGWTDHFTTEWVRTMVAGAGVWGMLLFVVVFAAGELLHVPGLVFFAAGILVWGRVTGGAIGYIAAVVSVTLSFCVVRGVSGRALGEVDRPLMKRLLARLEARPITTVLVLRSIFWMAPFLNYALALSTIRFREYFLGSALGLVIPIAAFAVLFGYLFE
jgi:uncharacterized membrane protein YdjX (TVP38/TMEM64 family)